MMDLLERFKEPSSYAPLMGVFTAIGWNLPDGMFQTISYGLAAIAGVLAFFMREKSK